MITDPNETLNLADDSRPSALGGMDELDCQTSTQLAKPDVQQWLEDCDRAQADDWARQMERLEAARLMAATIEARMKGLKVFRCSCPGFPDVFVVDKEGLFAISKAIGRDDGWGLYADIKDMHCERVPECDLPEVAA